MIITPGTYEPTGDIISAEEAIIKPADFSGVHYVKYKEWWNTKTITQAGDGWLRDRFYCPFPEDSKAYDEYWDEQESYVHHGFKHEGELVPGLEYLYLNFCPIWNKDKKQWIPPNFRTVDAEWFDEIEKAMAIGPYRDAEWKNSRPVAHITSKTRQSGHSLKGVVPVVYNMHFVPGSRNFIGAYQKTQAQKTNKYYQHYHDHLFMYTAWGKRWLRKEADEEYITGYPVNIKGQWVDGGFQSFLKLVGFADGFPEKAVGGGVDLFILEEIGVFPGLISAINFLGPSVKDGDNTTGAILGFGAAGSLEKAADLQEISYHPEAYDVWAYDNRWALPNTEYAKQKVVYFVPNYSCRPPHIDADGNPKQESAILAKEKAHAQLKTTNYEKYLEKVSQNPNSLEEMFAVRQRARYDAQIIDGHLAFLEANRGQLSHTVDLYLDYDANTDKPPVRYKMVDREPIWDSPVNPKKMSPEKRQGVVEIFEFPDPFPPHGLYIAAMDSYNQEDSTTDSLGCIMIYKKQTNLSGETIGRIVVAEYYGKPEDKKMLYRTFLYLQLLYNAIGLPENEDTELVPWYYNQGYEHMLADQPDLIRSLIPNSTSKRTKGIHAAWPLIKAAENKIQHYIGEVLGMQYNSEGKPIGPKYGITRLLSLGTVRELKRYVSDPDINFDRQRTLGWLLMFEEETFLDKVADPNYNDNATRFLANTNRFGDATQFFNGYTGDKPNTYRS